MSLDLYLQVDVDVGANELHRVTLFSVNITHNLGLMAKHAGLYELLWRPEEVPVESAKELAEKVRPGLARLLLTPEEFKKHNPLNGWGSYDGLVNSVNELLEACDKFPKAVPRAWR